MKASKTLIAVAVVTALAGGVSFAAAPMTEKQISDKALQLNPGATVQKTKMEKKEGKEVWEVLIKSKDGKEVTLYFNAETGAQVDKHGKEIKS
ncbi:MAG: PepSY domain-containing protein [Gammaproteobacteria bacterium]